MEYKNLMRHALSMRLLVEANIWKVIVNGLIFGLKEKKEKEGGGKLRCLKQSNSNKLLLTYEIKQE